MTEKQKNDVLYVCSLIETIARKTKNHRQDVIRHFTKADMAAPAGRSKPLPVLRAGFR